MRIALLLNTLSPGGAEKQALLLASLLNQKHHVTVIVLRPEYTDYDFVNRNVNSSLNIVSFKGGWLSKAYQLFTSLKRNRIQILLNYLLFPNFLGAVIGRMARVPKIVGGIRNSQLKPKKQILEKFIHNYLSHLTVFNNYKGRDNLIANGFDSTKCVVIPNCFDLSQSPRHRDKTDTPVVVTVGRYIEQKDHFTALNVVKRLVESGLIFRYQMIGWGRLEQDIRTWILANELNDVVELVVNPPNIHEYLNSADIFLSTSLFEGVPNAVMEAMSFSLPVVATDAGDMRYLIDNSKNGFIAEIQAEDQLQNNLAQLIDSHELRLEMGNYGYNKLKQEFGTDTFLSRYEAMFASML